MTRLDIQDVVVRFGGVTAVNGASITADGGQVTALIGPNGAGKTTLFNVVTGLQKPTDGRVFLDGNDITAMPTHQRARHGIARTFQRLEAFGSLTVAENIRVAADAAASNVRSQKRPGVAKVNPAAVTNGLIAKIGLERYAGAQADSVPTGIARLLELARALAIDPDLLLLDEPSSGLSETETEAFGELLRELAAQGRAVLIVEHDMSLIMRISDRIHVLDRGTLIASGTPAEIQADPLVRKAYLGEDESSAAVVVERPAERTLVMPAVRVEPVEAVEVVRVAEQPLHEDSIHRWLAPEYEYGDDYTLEPKPEAVPAFRDETPRMPTALELLGETPDADRLRPLPTAMELLGDRPDADRLDPLPTAMELLEQTPDTDRPPPLPPGPGPESDYRSVEGGWF